MWDIVIQFMQDRGVDRVIWLSLLGSVLLSLSIAYMIKPEKYLLHIIYLFTALVIMYPAYNYAIDYVEMSQSIVHADPAIRSDLIAEIVLIMQWHIWYPALFLVPSALMVIKTKISSDN